MNSRRIFQAALIFSLTLVLAPFAQATDEEEKAEQIAATAFVKKLQTLIAKNRKKDLADLVTYPLTMDGKTKAANADAFVRGYDAIVTPAVRECAREHDFSEEVFQRNGQYMVGWGCIWFSPDEKGGMTIDAVNTDKP